MLFFKTIKVNFFKIYIGQTYFVFSNNIGDLNKFKRFFISHIKKFKGFFIKKKEAKHEKTENFFNF